MKFEPEFPRNLSAWQALEKHHGEIRGRHLRELFRRNPNRAERFTLKAAGLFLDYSRNRIDKRTMELLVRLAREAGVESLRDAMFAGRHVNSTEDRAALHVALRAAEGDDYADQDQDCTADVHAQLERMAVFVEAVRGGAVHGYGARGPFTDVVNIGIGGSRLGAETAIEALRPYARDDLGVHFVSNVDGCELADLIARLDPRRTLFVVCSKSFSTQETLVNARAARAWIVDALGEQAVARHFAAVSTHDEAMDAFGIDPDFRLGFWDWAGGRFSVWSAVGLPLVLAIGMDGFRAFLGGARAMDRHFSEAPLDENLPVLLALLAIWYNDFFGAASQAILPYTSRLARLPAYLQQLHMESNGKSARKDGGPVAADTGTVVFGAAGNDAQHSFYQLLHQGTRLVPVDMIAPVKPAGGPACQHRLALIHMLAQAEALAFGRTPEETTARLAELGLHTHEQETLLPHRSYPGNRPVNLLLFEQLDPRTLGALMALYEHKVLVEGGVWGINSFDQWGVELGKTLADRLEGDLQRALRHARTPEAVAALAAKARRNR